MSLVTWVWPVHVMLNSPGLGQKTLSSDEPQQLGQGMGQGVFWEDSWTGTSWLPFLCMLHITAAFSLIFTMVQIHWFPFCFFIFQQQQWPTILHQISELVQFYHLTVSCLVFCSSRNENNYITNKSLQAQWRKFWNNSDWLIIIVALALA